MYTHVHTHTHTHTHTHRWASTIPIVNVAEDGSESVNWKFGVFIMLYVLILNWYACASVCASVSVCVCVLVVCVCVCPYTDTHMHARARAHTLKEYQSWLVVVAIVALGDAPKGAPVRVEAKVVVRWLLLIAWRYKLSQAGKG